MSSLQTNAVRVHEAASATSNVDGSGGMLSMNDVVISSEESAALSDLSAFGIEVVDSSDGVSSVAQSSGDAVSSVATSDSGAATSGAAATTATAAAAAVAAKVTASAATPLAGFARVRGSVCARAFTVQSASAARQSVGALVAALRADVCASVRQRVTVALAQLETQRSTTPSTLDFVMPVRVFFAHPALPVQFATLSGASCSDSGSRGDTLLAAAAAAFSSALGVECDAACLDAPEREAAVGGKMDAAWLKTALVPAAATTAAAVVAVATPSKTTGKAESVKLAATIEPTSSTPHAAPTSNATAAPPPTAPAPTAPTSKLTASALPVGIKSTTPPIDKDVAATPNATPTPSGATGNHVNLVFAALLVVVTLAFGILSSQLS